MDREIKQEDYVQKAEDAERQAQSVQDPEAAEKWRRIAAGYRDLAELAKRQSLRRRL